MKKNILIVVVFCFCSTMSSYNRVFQYERLEQHSPQVIKHFEKLKRNNGNLLFVKKQNRKVMSGADNYFRFACDYEICLPTGLKYRNTIYYPIFVYPENQAIIVSLPRFQIKTSSSDRYLIEEIKFPDLKDTVFYDNGEAEKLFEDLEDFMLEELNSCNIHFQRFKRFLTHYAELDIYPLLIDYGRKNVVIQKNNVQILLFNIKEENVEKWTSLLMQIKIYPKNAEEVKKDERITTLYKVLD